jgi:cytochrome P450
MIIFLYFPHIPEKAQKVVDEAVGRDRLPNFDDLSRMPYITAMIREAFRWRTVAPVAIPHAVVKDDIYAGTSYLKVLPSLHSLNISTRMKSCIRTTRTLIRRDFWTKMEN